MKDREGQTFMDFIGTETATLLRIDAGFMSSTFGYINFLIRANIFVV